MFNLFIITLMLNICNADQRTQPIASLIVFRGDGVNIYSGGRKTHVEQNKMPYTLSPGDEVATGETSDCEIFINNSGTLYVSPDSLVAVDSFKTSSSTITTRYGIVMFRGEKPVAVRTNDFSGYTSGGDFILKYKRSTFETTMFNFGKTAKVKRDIDKEFIALPTNSYANMASSFKSVKKIAKIKDSSIQKIYETFRVNFKPAGKITINENMPGFEDKAASLPYTKNANIDSVKKVIGL